MLVMVPILNGDDGLLEKFEINCVLRFKAQSSVYTNPLTRYELKTICWKSIGEDVL